MIKLLTLFIIFCAYTVDAQFSAAGQQAIVSAHNQLRSSIAKGTYRARGTPVGPSSNMRKIVWDQGIAAKAQAYANTHPLGHSQNRQGLGENLYWGNDFKPSNIKDPHGVKASKMWENEFQQFGLPTNIMSNTLMGMGLGHATQMAWADTHRIGCGVAGWQAGQWYKTVVVCQYGPAGNYMNRPIFKKGAQCSACPAGTRCESSSGLCA